MMKKDCARDQERWIAPMITTGALPMLVLLAILGTSARPAVAQERPSTGQLSNTTEMDTLYYECDQQGPALSCRFSQVKVSKSEPWSEEQIASEVEKGLASPPDDAFCLQVRSLVNNLPNTPDGKVLTGDELQQAQAMMPLFLAVCDNRSETTIRALVEFTSEREAKTCNVWTLPFDLEFTWNAQTSRWESLSQPAGACGAVTHAYMVKDSYFWNYGQQKIITNRTGSDPVLQKPCEEMPAETMNYQWQARTVHAQCEFIEFSLF